MYSFSPFLRRYWVAAWVSCLIGATQASGQTQRDWKLFPAVAEFKTPALLYAMGDVHGDYDRMVELLAGAGLIARHPASPAAVQWTGGEAVLVCTGDLIDKYDHSMGVIALLRALQPIAINAGGRIVVTMGNHEAEFLAGGGTDAKSDDFEAELKAAGISPVQVAAGKDLAGIGIWLRALPIAAKVGDWFFCHAGNTSGLTRAQLDQQIQTQVDQHGFKSPILVDDDSLLEARMHPRPWWDWDGKAPNIMDQPTTKRSNIDPGEDRLRTMIRALGANHLVFGHQPGKIKFGDGTTRAAGEMYQKYDGLVFLIDTGMSRGVAGGLGALLEISNGSVHGATAVYADGTRAALVR